MPYEVIEKKNWAAKWICGSTEYLNALEGLNAPKGAKWIWPTFNARALLRGVINAKKPTPAKAYFISDTFFDIYLNGELLKENVTRFEEDITLKEGENIIAVRGFTSGSYEFFTTALAGRVDYLEEGKEKSLVTDENWQWAYQSKFNNPPEPENWTTKNEKGGTLRYCDIHPRKNKHSLYFRKGFKVKGDVKSATLYIASKGEGEFYINGTPTSDERLCRGVTEKYDEYHTFDVKNLLKPGKNALGCITGNTWLNSISHCEMLMNRPCIMAELEIEYTDGSSEKIVTDKTFKCHASPLYDNDLQFGERYDARKEIDGWCDPDFDDSCFFAPEEKPSDFFGKKIVLRNYPGIKVLEYIEPISVRQKDKTDFIYDFGKNTGGYYKLILKNTRPGQKIIFKFGETLNEAGELNYGIYRPVFYNGDILPEGRVGAAGIKNYSFYICKGGEREIIEPKFTFSGFRYGELLGAEKSQIEMVYLAFFCNSLEPTGKIQSGYTPAEEIFTATRHTLLSNCYNGLVDCPTREKNYWTGDAHIFCPTAMYIADCKELLARWSESGRKMCDQVYGWGDEAYEIPLTLYKFTGDKNVLIRCLGNMERQVKIRPLTKGDPLPQNPISPFNDHLMPLAGNVAPNIDKYFFAHSFYCRMLSALGEIYGILGENEKAKVKEREFETAKAEFINRYFLEDQMDFEPKMQTGLVLPLAFGLFPKKYEAALGDKLNEYVLKDGRLDTGFIGTRYLLQLLVKYGHKDTAFSLINSEKWPSWRYMLSSGATTITESWHGLSADLNDSKNHFTFGSVVGFMFQCFGGIDFEKSQPGFKEVALCPTVIKEMGDFAVNFKSAGGSIYSGWKISGERAIYTFKTDMPARVIFEDGREEKFCPGEHSLEIKI